MAADDPALLQAVRDAALPIEADAPAAPAALVRALSRKRIALLGEATHGTHEFYALRAEITKALVLHHGCRAVVVAGDWPDAWHVDRWVRGEEGGTASRALAGFQRFPAWMWRNAVVLDFVRWLRGVNAARPPWERVGFYGMDLYSLSASVHAVLQYLDRTDPAAARRARLRYACFDHFQQNLQAYGHAAGFGTGFSCEDAVVAQLRELMDKRIDGAQAGDADSLFEAQQNARLVSSAEHYYRSLFHGRASSWNLRELHMAETLQALSAHLQDHDGAAPRMAVWAHNAHLGDASATAMADEGEWSVGELMRKRWPDDTFLLGFTTHDGTVRAAADWDGPAQVRHVPPSLDGSWEALFHAVGRPCFLLLPGEDRALRARLDLPLLERAIGVVYLPQAERRSHYLNARIGLQFDGVVHVDRTRAVEPLPDGAGAPAGAEMPQSDAVGA